MRTIFVLFDSLNRLAFGAYGGSQIKTPNFDRFAQKAVVFDRHYVGSLPCMPARRDLQTGRLNFTHRPWGPLEPHDNTFTSLLSKQGVYTHLITDDHHYFSIGGAGYVNAFDSWDFVRGQCQDPAHVLIRPPVEQFRQAFDSRHYPFDNLKDGENITRENSKTLEWRRTRHATNTLYRNNDEDFPTVQCFSRAFEFLETNGHADNWFLQLECFSPHEPFTSPKKYREAYRTRYNGKTLDWPGYDKRSYTDDETAEIRSCYAASVAMCDEQFGRLLDWMDENNAWDTTRLILTTDHGFLLGEHEWWGKNKMPYYEEIAHIPLMIWSPEMTAASGARYDGLTQTTDLMPTLLEMHGIEIPTEVTATSLYPVLMGGRCKRDSAILGMFGGPICVTDGRYAYHHYPKKEPGQDLYLYTLMPTHMVEFFLPQELASMEMVPPFSFTKGCRMMRVKMSPDNGEAGVISASNKISGATLFDLELDPLQKQPIVDQKTVDHLKGVIVDHLKLHEAAPDLFEYYGLNG